MRALLQRVSRASVAVDGQEVGRIGRGILALVGAGADDTLQDAQVLARKISELRIFPDSSGKFNLSLKDIQGEVLVVSQFTLYADTHKGRRPSFTDAAPPEEAEGLINALIRELKALNLPVECGQFQAHMEVSLVNDGPVTILLDTAAWRRA